MFKYKTHYKNPSYSESKPVKQIPSGAKLRMKDHIPLHLTLAADPEMASHRRFGVPGSIGSKHQYSQPLHLFL